MCNASGLPDSQTISADNIFATVREPMLVLDADMRVVLANRSFYQTFHVEPQQVEGRLIYELGNGQWDTPALKELLEQLLPQNSMFDDFEMTHDFPDIGRRTMLLNARCIYKAHEKNQFILLAIEDVTERKQAEAARIKLARAIESAGEAVITTDKAGVIDYVNPAFERLTGYTAEEVIGKTPGILRSGKHDAAFYERMWATILSGETWQDQVIDRKKNGDLYPAMLTISPFRSDEHEGFVGIQSDLSEYAALERQFLQAQKMEAVGTLVGGIAHDFNNVLSAIVGNLFMAKTKLRRNPESAAENLGAIDQLSHRAAGMIRQLLTFSRNDETDAAEMPLIPFIKETLKFMRTAIPENIAIHQEIGSGELLINGDATQLHQVLMNLINNARDALENVTHPCITVRLQTFEPDEHFLKSHHGFKPGEYARLVVEDNGCGVSEEHLPHLFDPFFTTKEAGKGTGLGLAMVYGAVQHHHGFIEVLPNEDAGLAFHIYLPLLTATSSSNVAAGKKQLLQGHGECILLADDDRTLCETLTDVLESLNYRVLQAANGREALELFEKHQGQISLALLDVVMPHSGGVEVARVIRASHADLPVIFLTGYDRDDVKVANRRLHNSNVLTKPVQITLLSICLRQMLDV